MWNILGNNTISTNHIKDGVFSPQNEDVDGRMETNNIDRIDSTEIAVAVMLFCCYLRKHPSILPISNKIKRSEVR